MSSWEFTALRIAEDVKKALLDSVSGIRGDIAELGRKVSRLKGTVRRRNQYDDSVIALCVECVETRSQIAAIRSATKTKVRLGDVFAYHKRKLVALGVATVQQFTKIIHAFRARMSRLRCKELEAKRAALALPVQDTKEYGILPPMRKAAQKLFTTALAMLTVAIACMASEKPCKASECGGDNAKEMRECEQPLE